MASRRWVVPGCGTQSRLAHSQLNGATSTPGDWVKVELAGVRKSTWKFQVSMRGVALLLFKPAYGLGAAAGGSARPSRSAGSSVRTIVPMLDDTAVAGTPASIAARSSA